MPTTRCESCGKANAEFNPRCFACGAALSVRSALHPDDGPAPAAAPEEPTLEGRCIGDYELEERLTGGAMGVVYRASDCRLHRTVALKLLPASLAGDPAAKARLLREAQAASALDHPNVATVYAIGEHEGRVFIAMAFYEGETLEQRIARGPVPFEEAASILGQLASALAAAHAVGIVHRDVKPSNVILTPQGQLKLLDFGLAKMRAPDTRAAPSLTAAGEVVGTIRYMAPEQLRGEAVDPRADLWALGVVGFELLTGVAPFRAESGIATITRILTVTPSAPRALRPDVPPELEELVLWLLRKPPEERPAEAGDVLRVLEGAPLPARARRRPRARRAVLAGVLGAALVALVIVLATRDGTAPASPVLCRGSERRTEARWNPAAKRELEKSFMATGAAAAGVWGGVERGLDQYLAGWARMHTESCEATHLRGWQSSALLDLRMQCLDEVLGEAWALLDLFAKPDAALVQRAAEAVSKLPRVARCANLKALSAIVKPPEDPRIQAEVAGVRSRLVQARALSTAGRFAPAQALAAQAAEQARALDYPPLQAEALALQGSLLERTARYAEAERVLYEAVWAAEKGRHDEVKARAWTLLAWLVGVKAGARHEEGLRIVEHARTALERLGGNAEVEANLLETLGTIQQGREPETTLRVFARALELRERVFGADSAQVAHSLAALGNAYAALGREAERLAAYERALAILERVTGPTNPRIALLLNNLGNIRYQREQYREALGYFARALAIKEQTLGKEHPDLAITLHNMGDALRKEGRFAEALARYEEALALWAKKLRSGHPLLAHPLTGIGEVHLALGQPQRAMAPLSRALRIREEAKVAPGELAETRFALARSLGARQGGRALARQAIDDYRKDPRDRRARIAEIERWLQGAGR